MDVSRLLTPHEYMWDMFMVVKDVYHHILYIICIPISKNK
jgi:hypothetical protein